MGLGEVMTAATAVCSAWEMTADPQSQCSESLCSEGCGGEWRFEGAERERRRERKRERGRGMERELLVRDIMARRAGGNESFLHTFAYRVMHFWLSNEAIERSEDLSWGREKKGEEGMREWGKREGGRGRIATATGSRCWQFNLWNVSRSLLELAFKYFASDALYYDAFCFCVMILRGFESDRGKIVTGNRGNSSPMLELLYMCNSSSKYWRN